jgi:hypothetical protein
MARPTLWKHPKFLRLVHSLGEPVPHLVGYLECMWSVGYESGDPVLGDATAVELAAQWPGKRGKLCKALVTVGFLDALDGGRYAIHDLIGNAPDYVQGRARREAERKREKTCARCGRPYHSADMRARFCSHACRQASYRQRPVTQRDPAASRVRHAPSRAASRVRHARDAARDADGPQKTRKTPCQSEGVTHVTERDGALRHAPSRRHTASRVRHAQEAKCDAARDANYPPGRRKTPCQSEVRDARDAALRSVTERDGTPAPAPLTKEEHPLPPQGGTWTELFVHFWEAYPKHRRKQRPRALEEWGCLEGDPALLQRMLSALQAQARSEDWQRMSGQYVPSAWKWLRDRSWEAYPPADPTEPRRERTQTEPPPNTSAELKDLSARLRGTLTDGIGKGFQSG